MMLLRNIRWFNGSVILKICCSSKYVHGSCGLCIILWKFYSFRCQFRNVIITDIKKIVCDTYSGHLTLIDPTRTLTGRSESVFYS